MRYQVRITVEHDDRDRVFFALETDSLTDAVARWYTEITLGKRTCIWDNETQQVAYQYPLGYMASFLFIGPKPKLIEAPPTYIKRHKKPSGLKITFES